MRKLVILLLCLTNALFAQEILQTENGPVKLSPIQHATMVLEWNGLTFYIDPYGGAEKFEAYPDADYILITDIHGDHLNAKTLAGLNTSETIFLVPKAVADQLSDISNKAIKIINNGETIDLAGFKVAAIPMYNLPESSDSRHTKGRGNGYILTLGGKTIYISGDTEAIPEMRSLEAIDAAFVCMNLPYTMDVEQAASGVLDFKPKQVIPYHYRGQGGLADVQKFKQLVQGENKQIAVTLLDWYQ